MFAARTSLLAFLATGLMASAALAGPSSLANGTYLLGNHPDGEAASPYYGMRLDGLDGTNNHRFTFDFNDQRSRMLMTLNVVNNTGFIRIYGQAWGGYDVGSTYENPSNGRTGLWEIDFTYRTNLQRMGDGSVRVSMSPQNNGHIQPLFNSSRAAFANNAQIPLVDYMMPSFHLETGHRGFAGWSGYGWMNHSGRSHVAASDWLFTVCDQVVPSPTAASLGMLGLALVNGLRRRVL